MGTNVDLDRMLGDPRKAILSMTLPLIVSYLVVQVNLFADTAWCSLLGSDASSAISTICPIYSILTGVGIGLGIGASTSIARCLGRDERTHANSLAAQTVFVSAIIAVVLTPIAFLCIDPTVGWMGADSIKGLCHEYMAPLTLGTISLVMNGVVSGLLRAEGAAGKSTLVLLTSAILNMILDPLLLFVLDMGLSGAGWATTVSMTVSTVLGLSWYVRNRMYVTISFKGFRMNTGEIRDILSVGVPRSMELFLIYFMSMVQRVLIIDCGGEIGVALYNIPWMFVTISQVMSQSIGSAMIPVCSAALGAGDTRKAEDGFRYSIIMTLGSMTLLAAIIFLAAGYLVIPFTMSPSMEAIRPDFEHVMRIYALLIPFVGLIDISSSILQSIRLAQVSMISSFIRNIILIAMMWFAGGTGMEAIYWSIFIAEVIGGLMMYGLSRIGYRTVRMKSVREGSGMGNA